jgi:hypothetical protein
MNNRRQHIAPSALQYKWERCVFVYGIVACALLIAMAAQASDCEDSARTVVTQIKAQANQSSIEYAAVIVRKADSSVISSPLVMGSNDTFKLTVGLHKGDSICALVHSHPGTNSSAQLFSAPDVAMAKQLNVASYIYLVASDTLKAFVPAKDSVTLGRNSTDTAQGHII